jgi:hypothetical protein
MATPKVQEGGNGLFYMVGGRRAALVPRRLLLRAGTEEHLSHARKAPLPRPPPPSPPLPPQGPKLSQPCTAVPAQTGDQPASPPAAAKANIFYGGDAPPSPGWKQPGLPAGQARQASPPKPRAPALDPALVAFNVAAYSSPAPEPQSRQKGEQRTAFELLAGMMGGRHQRLASPSAARERLLQLQPPAPRSHLHGRPGLRTQTAGAPAADPARACPPTCRRRARRAQGWQARPGAAGGDGAAPVALQGRQGGSAGCQAAARHQRAAGGAQGRGDLLRGAGGWRGCCA